MTGVGPLTYTYDANGNELTAGSTSYVYDLADRLTGAHVGSTTETYAYSGDGIRLSSSTGSQAAKTIRFVVDRAFALPTVVIERDGANKTLRRYVYGADLLSQTTPTKGPYWYHHDGLGSVSDITSSTGTPLAWAEYTPFGAPRASASTSQAPLNPFRFTGQYLDTISGLYHMRARQYDPTIGRFTGADPQPENITGPQVNTYGYAYGNPVRYVDPSGKDPLCAGVFFAAAETGPLDLLATATCFAVTALVVVAVADVGRALYAYNTDRWYADPWYKDSGSDPTHVGEPLTQTFPHIGPYVDIHLGNEGGGRCHSKKCRLGVAAGVGILIWSTQNGSAEGQTIDRKTAGTNRK